jgi:hypothetical protein
MSVKVPEALPRAIEPEDIKVFSLSSIMFDRAMIQCFGTGMRIGELGFEGP